MNKTEKNIAELYFKGHKCRQISETLGISSIVIGKLLISPTQAASIDRIKEIENAKIWCLDYWLSNPNDYGQKMAVELKKETGIDISYTEINTWKRKLKKLERSLQNTEVESTSTSISSMDELINAKKMPGAKAPILPSPNTSIEEVHYIETLDGFFGGIDKLIEEIKELKREKEDWERKAKTWAARVVELQNLISRPR